MSRGLAFQVGGFYHIYNRGTEKRDIFTETRDYERFQALLYLGNSTLPVHVNSIRHRGLTSVPLGELLCRERGEPIVDICAYVLMTNHFHLLLHEREPGGISRFMQKTLTAYTMYFNTRYEHSGALFQGTFKGRDANRDLYLKYLLSYMHLNAITLIEPGWKETGILNRKGVEIFLNNYPYSSYLDYCGEKRIENAILDIERMPVYFKTRKDLSQHISDWIENKDAEV